MADSQKRQVARKVRIKDLVDGTYIKAEGEWTPNFIQTGDGRTFSRVNLMSVVVSEPVPDLNFNTFVIDDGTGRLPVRLFGEQSPAVDVKLGEIILLIGRPREFNQQIYIVPEIIKKIENSKWIDYRKLELELEEQRIAAKAPEKPKTEPIMQATPPPVDEAKEDESQAPAVETIADKAEADEKPLNTIDKIIGIIKQLDKGDGAETEDVISVSKVDNAESIVDNLLKEGEIFEVRSGKIKVLE